MLTVEQQQIAQINGHTVQILQKTTIGKYNSNSLGILPTDTTVEPEDSSVQEIEQSVGTYGGFYIAKYEAGIEGTKSNHRLLDNKKATDGTYKPLSKANVGVWNGITRQDSITVSKAMINYEETGVHSTLISGTAWDTTLQWITNTVDSTYAEDSEGKGVSGGTGPRITGSNIEYSKNNIYDMAGNVSEWTTENCTKDGNSYVVSRGSFYYYDRSARPAAIREYSDGGVFESTGFRVVIYK